MPKPVADLVEDLDDAIKSNDMNAVLEIFKEENFDVNCWGGRNSRTPLHAAIANRNPLLVRLFLQMGANPNTTCTNGSAIDMAYNTGDPELFKLLIWNTRLKGVSSNKEEDGSFTIEYVIPHDGRINTYSLVGDKVSKKGSIIEANHKDLSESFSTALKNGDVELLRSTLAKGYVYDDSKNSGFKDALESGSFGVIKALLNEGVYACEGKWKTAIKEAGSPPIIVQLIELEKQKQLELMEAFVKHEKEPDLLRVTIDICDKYENKVTKLEKENADNIKSLYKQIDELERYGRTLENTEEDDEDKGAKVIRLASKIRDQVNLFLLDDTSDKKQVRVDLGKIIAEGQKTMGEDRKLQDILAHIALACTLVGLLIMGVNKLITGSFFLNATQRQKLLSNVDEKVQHGISKPKP